MLDTFNALFVLQISQNYKLFIPIYNSLLPNAFPSINFDLVPEELDHIAEWTKENNLNLNSSKSEEMIIRRPKTRPDDLPGQIAGIERV